MANSGENQRPSVPQFPWSEDSESLLDDLVVDPKEGLSSAEASRRSRIFGPNHLEEAEKEPWWSVLLHQFKSLIVVLLAVAAGLSFLFGENLEGIAILAVILINGIIGFVTELRAIRSMEALRRLGTVSTKVRRDGSVQEISAEDLVPGDIVILEGGDVISADLRLLETSRMEADESTLTGESLPVGKQSQPVDREVPLAERASMLFKGTAVTRGSGTGVVVNTGMDTELGKISSLVATAEKEITPLEKRLQGLGRKLVWVTVVVAALVTVSGLLAGRELFLMIETGIALAVATVPEGLPIVATIALARGMLRMARKNALINRLSAVETLGATTVICTDKTGTLTENRMTVTNLSSKSEDFSIPSEDEGIMEIDEKSVLRAGFEVAALCNNATLGPEGKSVGDPMEIALLSAASKAGIERDDLIERLPEEREEAFDSSTKMMATYHRMNSNYRVAVKGAPEEVIKVCSGYISEEGAHTLDPKDSEELLEENRRMAESGLRVLALAQKEVRDPGVEPYEDLNFIALVGLEDPPRKEVKASIQSCKKAGIRVIMVTGDQAVTARNIAVQVGLSGPSDPVMSGQRLKELADTPSEGRSEILNTSVFARVDPKQKLDLIDIHQKNGSIVAMTGDGVNDAPALKEADIGVAMGQRGTQVAREAADMILEDDSFSTIATAVEQGRVIFDNIRKVVYFLLSCNLSEIMVVGLASIANAPLPILPLQILFLNLVTDIFPALAMATGSGHPNIMERKPRDPEEPILPRSAWMGISGYGSIITVSVLMILFMGLSWLGMSESQAVTASFLTLAFAQLWHVFNMRGKGTGILRNELTQNIYIWGSLALCTGLLFAAVYLPPLAMVLRTTDPGNLGWLLIFALSSVVLIIGQLYKELAD